MIFGLENGGSWKRDSSICTCNGVNSIGFGVSSRMDPFFVEDALFFPDETRLATGDEGSVVDDIVLLDISVDVGTSEIVVGVSLIG